MVAAHAHRALQRMKAVAAGAAPAPGPELTKATLHRYGLAGMVAGTVVVASAMTGGDPFVSHLPGAWFFGTPGGPLGSIGAAGKHVPAVAVLGVYGGLAALAVIWWRLIRALGRSPGTPVRAVLGVVVLWAVPFLLAPPLFSNDIYNYAGQGELVRLHINPYVYGPGTLGATRFNLLAGSLWANTPSPYGPLWLRLVGVVTSLSAHSVLADLVLLRLVAVIGVALIAAGLPTLARAVGRDPAAAVLLGAGSPLVLSTLIGGGHNDALMVGMLVAGLAVWVRFGPLAGVVVCAAAAGVKAPALLAVVFIGWNWDRGAVRLRRRLARAVEALALAAAELAVLSAVTGMGWGWVRTLGAAGRISTGVTPVDAAAHVVTDVLHASGSAVSFTGVRTVAMVVGALVAVAVAGVLLWYSPRLGPLPAVGGALLAAALLSPVLWAWYATWGLVVLAAVVSGRWRGVVVWITVAETLIGAASVLAVMRSLRAAGPFADVLVGVGVVAACLLAERLPYDAAERRPWLGQRALQPAGVTVTASQRPHRPQ